MALPGISNANEFYSAHYLKSVLTGDIEVNWEPQAGQFPASATIAAHLAAGRYNEAIPLLRTRLQLEPDHVESLYNLGMVYSDQMKLKEARDLLGRAVELDPADANAQTPWCGGPAVVLQPRNPFALRTLGQLHLMQGDAAAALPHLRSAAAVAEADELLQRALRLAPVGTLVGKDQEPAAAPGRSGAARQCPGPAADGCGDVSEQCAGGLRLYGA